MEENAATKATCIAIVTVRTAEEIGTNEVTSPDVVDYPATIDGDADDVMLVSPLLDGGGINSDAASSENGDKRRKRRCRPNPLLQRPSGSIYHDVPRDVGIDDETDEFDRRLDRRIPPLRVLLLSMYLSFTLAAFWILDSVKEPALAALVPDGDLGRHQPRAKMASFAFAVALAMGLEYANSAGEACGRRRQPDRRDGDGESMDMTERRNAEVERSTWERRNEGGGGWRKMGIRSGRLRDLRRRIFGGDDNREDCENNVEGSLGITVATFYVVGFFYILAFLFVASAMQARLTFGAFGGTGSDDVTTDAVGSGGMDEYTGNEGVPSPRIWYLSEYIPSYATMLGYLLFVLVESYGSVSIAIFWSFANSHLTLKAAEIYYGAMIGIAQVGSISGSTLAAVLGSRSKRRRISGDVGGTIAPGKGSQLLPRFDAGSADLGLESAGNSDAEATPLLFILACVCIGAGVLIIVVYSNFFPGPMSRLEGRSPRQSDRCASAKRGAAGLREMSKEESSIIVSKPLPLMTASLENRRSSPDLLGGLRMIFRHDYLQLVLAVSILYEVAMTCLHYEMTLIVSDRFGNHDGSNRGDEEREPNTSITFVQFMGWYGQTVNVLSLLFSFYAFPCFIKWYGLAKTLRIFPTVLLFVTIMTFVVLPSPNLLFLFLSLSLCKALTYSVQDPSEELLYMPTSDAIKYRAKLWIDVVGTRVAKAVGSSVNTYAGSVDGIMKFGGLPSVLASLALWMACYLVGARFNKLIQRGEVLGSDDDEEDEVELLFVDADCYNSSYDDKRNDGDDDMFVEPNESQTENDRMGNMFHKIYH